MLLAVLEILQNYDKIREESLAIGGGLLCLGGERHNILSTDLVRDFNFRAAFGGGLQFFKPYKFYQLLKQHKIGF